MIKTLKTIAMLLPSTCMHCIYIAYHSFFEAFRNCASPNPPSCLNPWSNGCALATQSLGIPWSVLADSLGVNPLKPFITISLSL